VWLSAVWLKVLQFLLSGLSGSGSGKCDAVKSVRPVPFVNLCP